MIIHSLSGVKGRLIFINRGCKSHLKNNTNAKRKLYLMGGFIFWDSALCLHAANIFRSPLIFGTETYSL